MISETNKETEVSSADDVFALGPATQILQQIRSEHLYSTPSSCSLDEYCSYDERPSTSKDESLSDIAYMLNKLKDKTGSKNLNSNRLSADGELDMLSLSAASIQKQFQNMIDMTSFTEIQDTFLGIEDNIPSTSRQRKVNFVENLSESDSLKKDDNRQPSSVDPSKAKVDKEDTTDLVKDKLGKISDKRSFEKEKTLKYSKTSDKSKIKRSKTRRILSEPEKKNSEKTQCKSVNKDDWRTINKVFEAERTLNLYLKHTAELLVRRWGEYLSMTSEQIRQFEIQNAKEAGMIDEVVEMLEDKDRYVWQLIEDLRFW